MLYYGTIPEATAASAVDVSTLQTQTRLDGQVTFPTFGADRRLVLCYPSTASAITRLDIGGTDQLAAFTLHGAVLQVSGVNYDVLRGHRIVDGTGQPASVATITR